ncbi:DUF2262 domain-containing protein [Ralstonia pickettii]|nr:DUF2262 domain-containing protein [Ralstonia pickettii]
MSLNSFCQAWTLGSSGKRSAATTALGFSRAWGSSTVGIKLVPDDRGQITGPLEVARELSANQSVWMEKVRNFSASRLLDLKNESWLDTGEAPLTAGDFLRKVSIESVVVDADGVCEFWLNDGALFSGHSIVVRGSVSDGLVDAEIAG